jgi:hypothetical protein
MRANRQRFVEAPKRIDKSVIAASIGSSLRENGAHFVKQDKKSKHYYELNDDQAHKKIGHAFWDVFKTLDSSDQKKTDSLKPLLQCVFSSNEKPSYTKADISQKDEPAAASMHLSAMELSPSFPCSFSSNGTVSLALELSQSLFRWDADEEIGASAQDLPMLTTSSDVGDKERDANIYDPYAPLVPFSSEPTFA